MEGTLKNTDEQERLKALATGVIREFKHDELRDVTATSEVLVLTLFTRKAPSGSLGTSSQESINPARCLFCQLEGLARPIQGAKSGCLDADDFNIHTTSIDPYLVYRKSRLCPSSSTGCLGQRDTLAKGAGRSGKVIQGVSGFVITVKGLDLSELIQGLKDIQRRQYKKSSSPFVYPGLNENSIHQAMYTARRLVGSWASAEMKLKKWDPASTKLLRENTSLRGQISYHSTGLKSARAEMVGFASRISRSADPVFTSNSES
ncbi:MAG: hypothetical protein J3Q66DRAFT_422958 [Benniella sp.]|nr:MAG: hypothetical protein J3Q66DRAFT_422958 [Benniella sp.]